MKIIFNKNELFKALQIVQRATKVKNISNVNNGFLFIAKNNQVEIQGNDYEIEIKVTLPAIVEEEGEIVLLHSYLQDLIKKMPGEEVIFAQTEKNKITITSEKATFNLLVVDKENFPVIEEIEEENVFKIDSIDLKNIIDDTTFACATEESRPLFTGVLFNIVEDEITTVGTNTHRMAIKKGQLLEKIKEEISVIVPAKNLKELAPLLAVENPEEIKVNISFNKIYFTFSNVFFSTRLIEGQYPNYKKVIPPKFDVNILINRRNFNDAVERVSLITKMDNFNIINYTFNDRNIVLSTQNPDAGSVDEIVDCEINGSIDEISFNSKYILDILSHLNQEEIILSIKDKGPMMVKQRDDKTYTYIVTPMRTN